LPPILLLPPVTKLFAVTVTPPPIVALLMVVAPVVQVEPPTDPELMMSPFPTAFPPTTTPPDRLMTPFPLPEAQTLPVTPHEPLSVRLPSLTTKSPLAAAPPEQATSPVLIITSASFVPSSDTRVPEPANDCEEYA